MAGEASSRSDFIHHALEREYRRHAAEQDVKILLATRHEDNDLDGIFDYASRHHPDLD